MVFNFLNDNVRALFWGKSRLWYPKKAKQTFAHAQIQRDVMYMQSSQYDYIGKQSGPFLGLGHRSRSRSFKDSPYSKPQIEHEAEFDFEAVIYGDSDFNVPVSTCIYSSPYYELMALCHWNRAFTAKQ